jgi:hypothetical protein
LKTILANFVVIFELILQTRDHGQILKSKNDIAFKRIFGSEKNEDILIAMLNCVLKGQLCSPIKKVEFLPTFIEPEAMAKKQSIVDVLCRDSDGCRYIIEMQVAESKGFEKRAILCLQGFYKPNGQGGAVRRPQRGHILSLHQFLHLPRKESVQVGAYDVRQSYESV